MPSDNEPHFYRMTEADNWSYCETSPITGKSRIRGSKMGRIPIQLYVTCIKDLIYINLCLWHQKVLQTRRRVKQPYEYRRIS